VVAPAKSHSSSNVPSPSQTPATSLPPSAPCGGIACVPFSPFPVRPEGPTNRTSPVGTSCGCVNASAVESPRPPCVRSPSAGVAAEGASADPRTSVPGIGDLWSGTPDGPSPEGCLTSGSRLVASPLSRGTSARSPPIAGPPEARDAQTDSSVEASDLTDSSWAADASPGSSPAGEPSAGFPLTRPPASPRPPDPTALPSAARLDLTAALIHPSPDPSATSGFDPSSPASSPRSAPPPLDGATRASTWPWSPSAQSSTLAEPCSSAQLRLSETVGIRTAGTEYSICCSPAPSAGPTAGALIGAEIGAAEVTDRASRRASAERRTSDITRLRTPSNNPVERAAPSPRGAASKAGSGDPTAVEAGSSPASCGPVCGRLDESDGALCWPVCRNSDDGEGAFCDLSRRPAPRDSARDAPRRFGRSWCGMASDDSVERRTSPRRSRREPAPSLRARRGPPSRVSGRGDSTGPGAPLRDPTGPGAGGASDDPTGRCAAWGDSTGPGASPRDPTGPGASPRDPTGPEASPRDPAGPGAGAASDDPAGPDAALDDRTGPDGDLGDPTRPGAASPDTTGPGTGAAVRDPTGPDATSCDPA
jgi:hypothetical protein